MRVRAFEDLYLQRSFVTIALSLAHACCLCLWLALATRYVECVCVRVFWCVFVLLPLTPCHRELQQFEKARLQMRIADKPSVLHKRLAGIYGCIIA